MPAWTDAAASVLVASGHGGMAALVAEHDDVARLVARLRDDRRFADELAICARAGIPHSFFLGGPHQWSDLDRDKAVAFSRFEALRCPGCHTFADEWTDAEGNELGDPAYIAVVSRCWGCNEVEEMAAHLSKNGRDTKGQRIGLRPFDPDADEELLERRPWHGGMG